MVPTAEEVAQRYFQLAIRLLGNMSRWRPVIGSPRLERLALEALAANKVLPAVRARLPDLEEALLGMEQLVEALSGRGEVGWVGRTRNRRYSFQLFSSSFSPGKVPF